MLFRSHVLLLDEPAAGVPEAERHDLLATIAALPDEVVLILHLRHRGPGDTLQETAMDRTMVRLGPARNVLQRVPVMKTLSILRAT